MSVAHVPLFYNVTADTSSLAVKNYGDAFIGTYKLEFGENEVKHKI